MTPKMTFEDFVKLPQAWPSAPGPDLVELVVAIARACRGVGEAAALGGLMQFEGRAGLNVQGEAQTPLDVVANDIFVRECGPHVCGLVSEELDAPLTSADSLGRAQYLLAIDPLDGSSNAAFAMSVGAFFSVLPAPRPEPLTADFLRPGSEQIVAGYALFGSTTMLVVTFGRGTHGFTLDPADGVFRLTHPHMQIAPTTREYAINASNERFWEPPVQHYVEDCLLGASGVRGGDFNMRWNGALVAELHRILIRGGVFLYPWDSREPRRKGRLRLLYEANPVAMLVEAAGGAASTGRERILDVEPSDIHERTPLIFGASAEVARLYAHHADYDRGEAMAFTTPLFHDRSLFRSA